jgi:hypothetical protein
MIDIAIKYSSNIQRVQYDDLSHELIVDFKGDRSYSYGGVPEHTMRALVESASAGAFFADNIRGKYPTRRLK